MAYASTTRQKGLRSVFQDRIEICSQPVAVQDGIRAAWRPKAEDVLAFGKGLEAMHFVNVKLNQQKADPEKQDFLSNSS